MDARLPAGRDVPAEELWTKGPDQIGRASSRFADGAADGSGRKRRAKAQPFRWSLKGPGLQPVTLAAQAANDGETKTLSFVPSDHVSVACGGRVVELEVRATDPDAMTGTKTLTVTLMRPPC